MPLLERHLESRSSQNNAHLPPVAVVFISIALGFAVVLLYSFIAIAYRLQARRVEDKFKQDTRQELSETAELLIDSFIKDGESGNDDDLEEEEDRAHEDGLDVVNPSSGDGSAAETPTPHPNPNQETNFKVHGTSDGADLQKPKPKGKKPLRRVSIQDGAEGPMSPLDALKEEIDRQLAEIKEESQASLSEN